MGVSTGRDIGEGDKPGVIEDPSQLIVRGAMHEWFGVAWGGVDDRGWVPALDVLRWGAGRLSGTHAGHVVWVGRRCWASAGALDRVGLAGRSVLVDARSRDDRVWAMDTALRCDAVALVVGDGASLSMAETRRLALAARAGDGVGLVARPEREAGAVSAARTRWRVRACTDSALEADGHGFGWSAWTVRLLRCKGLRPGEARAEGLVWKVRMSHETRIDGNGQTGDVGVVPETRDRSPAPTTTPRSRARVA